METRELIHMKKVRKEALGAQGFALLVIEETLALKMIAHGMAIVLTFMVGCLLKIMFVMVLLVIVIT